ncbi:MAG TPA: DUF885 domain-containing protein [bacterium]|nr:DUF885 domain-containing protein [bacterium]
MKSLVQEYLQELFDFQPVWALASGRLQAAAKTADLSEARIARHLAAMAKISRKLGRARPRAWGEARLEWELLRSDVKLREREWKRTRKYRIDPSMYVGELTYGLWYLLLRVDSPKLKVEAALARMNEAGSLLEAARRNLRRPPRLWTRLAIEETGGLLAFLADVRAELLQLAPKRAAEIRAAYARAKATVEGFREFYRGPLLKRSTGRFAVGRREYDFLLKNYHHYTIDSKRLRRIGEEQFKLARRALVEQARRIDPKKSWPGLVEEAKRRHPSAERLLSVYRRETAALRSFVRRNKIVSLPRGESLRVIETPEFTRNTIPFAAYVDPPMFGGKNQGTFFVTPVTAKGKKREELLGEHSYGALRVTALHEGYPGHHLQFAVQKHAPGTMMKIYNCSSFFEGWALYCEELMHEAGYYDDWGRLLQLKDKLWRACRILVDVGLHTGTMSDAQAVRFMAKELKMSPASARADVNWYTMRPTVPQSYLTGMLRLRELREKCRRKWGRRFNFQRFHDAVLRYGAIPVPLLEKVLLAKGLA